MWPFDGRTFDSFMIYYECENWGYYTDLYGERKCYNGEKGIAITWQRIKRRHIPLIDNEGKIPAIKGLRFSNFEKTDNILDAYLKHKNGEKHV